MYLDTDILVALLKKTDWLKLSVNTGKLKKPKTSVLNVIEAQLVLSREHSEIRTGDIIEKIKELKIGVVSIDVKVLELSSKISIQNKTIGIFDSIHAACAIAIKEKIISTDHIYDTLSELERIDPRNL